MATKVCKDCGVEKDLEQFSIKKHNKDGSVGRQSQCKPCRQEYEKARKEKTDEDYKRRERLVASCESKKVCYRCREEKDLDQFSNNSKTSSGKSSYCKECQHKYQVEFMKGKRRTSTKEERRLAKKEEKRLYMEAKRARIEAEKEAKREARRKAAEEKKYIKNCDLHEPVRYPKAAAKIKLWEDQEYQEPPEVIEARVQEILADFTQYMISIGKHDLGSKRKKPQ